MSQPSSEIYSTHEGVIKALVISSQPVQKIIDQMKDVYLADKRPWIIGFCGGKDFTVILSLVYSMLLQLSQRDRCKHVYVVSSDTLVETPVVVKLIKEVIEKVNVVGRKSGIPISAHTVYPNIDQTFWVNLLGRGYPVLKQSLNHWRIY